MPASSYPSGTFLALVGTKRGVFVLTSRDRRKWTVERQTLPGSRVFNAVYDGRNGGRMFAADNGDFFGTFLKYSDDMGETWQEPKKNIEFAEESGHTLKNIWLIQPGRPDEPGTLYAGVDEASLWVSKDNGDTWHIVSGLENHPTRDKWNPGAGGLCLHSIVPDPTNKDRMWIGISAVGCMRTDDGGKTWKHANKSTRAGFLPDPYPEFGQCIHRLIQHPSKPDTLYQQNHCGIYMSENAGDVWTDIGEPYGESYAFTENMEMVKKEGGSQSKLPSEFGFPIALDAHNPETLYTIVEFPMGRFNYPSSFRVYRTENAGKSWETLTNGLPDGAGVKLGVLRHGMTADTLDPCGIYVGTNTGQLFVSADRGETWQLAVDFLPSIYSVNVTVL